MADANYRLAGKRGGWRHPGWSWTVRHDRVIPAGYGLSALFAGGALSTVLALAGSDWKRGQTWDQLWLLIVLSVLAIAALAVAETAQRGRDRMIRQNGTAYIIEEQARGWTEVQNEGFLADVRRQFARVVEVPGPYRLDTGWDWPLDDRARQWDAKMNELVRAFQVLNRDARSPSGAGLAGTGGRPGAGTPNSVFIWAWWVVAMAFGMRVTAAERGLALDVWQRPTYGRAGEELPQPWAQRPHRFRSGAPAGLDMKEISHTVELTVSRRGHARGTHPGRDVTVLLIRFNKHRWGPFPEVNDPLPDDPLAIHLYDAAGVIAPGTSQTQLHELRCVADSGLFGWNDYPALVAKAADWVERKTLEFAGNTLLLGAQLPQEVGLGVGVLAGQEASRANWPEHLWPVVYNQEKAELVVPNLGLGTLPRAGGGT